MDYKFSKIISFVFQPLLMSTYLFIVLLFFTTSTVIFLPSPEIKGWFLLVIFITTFIIPLSGVFAFRLSKSIDSIEMPEREQRVIPFFFIALFYAVAAFLMVSKLNISSLVNVIMIATAILVFIAAVITYFWKVSIHSIGVMGVLGFLLGINYKSPDPSFFYPILIWILICGITLSSRLYLNVHKPSEVYVGSIIGFLIAATSILIFT